MKNICRTLSVILTIVMVFTMLPIMEVAAENDYLWPVPSSTKINQYYYYNSSNDYHDGLDIGGSSGCDIVATMSGTVIAVLDGDVPNKWVGYGKGVVIKHANGYYSHYAHMSSTCVTVNQAVLQGQRLGGMGATGNATGVHLHFAVATSQYGAGGRINVNPDALNYIYSSNSEYWPFTSVWAENISTDSAVIHSTISGRTIQNAGFYLGSSPATMGKDWVENINKYTENIWYDIKGECGITLSPSTTYYYAFYVTINGKEYVSETKTFTTGVGSAAFTEVYSSDVTNNNAQIHARLNKTYVREIGFYLGTSSNNMSKVWNEAPATNDGSLLTIDNNLKDECHLSLTEGTTYYYKFYIILKDNGYEIQSDVKYFTTTGSTTSVFNEVYSSDVTENNVQIHARLNKVYVREIGFYLGTSANNLSKVWNEAPATNDGSLLTIDNDLKDECHVNLKHATTYYYKFYIILKSDGSEVQSGVESFKTGGSHTYSSSTVTKPASCTETGIKTLTCNCGATKTEVIDKLPHTEEVIPAVEATCTATGLTEGKKCSVCGAVLIAQYTVETKAHVPSDWIVKIDPTETTEGLKVKECVNCHVVLESEELPIIEPEHLAGDINGDNVVNNKDLTRLMKYLAGENVDVVEAALDINGDGVVNNKDLTRLMKYLAGENVTIC